MRWMTLWREVVVVSFHTTDPQYTREEERLHRSVERFRGLQYVVESIPPPLVGGWKAVCRMKPAIIRRLALAFWDRPVLFVDADAVLCRDPREEVPNTWKDGEEPPAMSVHTFGSQPCSGTIILAPGEQAQKVLAEWERVDRKEGDSLSQPQKALHHVKGINGALGPQWCWIFDLSPQRFGAAAADPIVTHYQASREYRVDRPPNEQLRQNRRTVLQQRFGEVPRR